VKLKLGKNLFKIMIQEDGYQFDERGQINTINLGKNGGKHEILIVKL
jgi:hypothetical protein